MRVSTMELKWKFPLIVIGGFICTNWLQNKIEVKSLTFVGKVVDAAGSLNEVHVTLAHIEVWPVVQ